MKIKKTIIEILKKHGDLQTNLVSNCAQEQITKEIIAAVMENIDDST
jgi:hypothetical protein